MFKPIRSSLVKGLNEKSFDTRVMTKLLSFLNQNPDVDHYLSDRNKLHDSVNFWMGVMMGGLVILMVVCFALGYLWNQHIIGFL